MEIEGKYQKEKKISRFEDTLYIVAVSVLTAAVTVGILTLGQVCVS